MPYPMFTKAIIHYFMSQHKLISKRQHSSYHTVNNDDILDRLKFINKGEEYQVYGKPIPSTLVTNDIQKFEAYKTFISISTSLKKATFASKKKKKKVSIHDESRDEESEEQEERLVKKPRGVVIQDTPQVPKTKSTDPSLKQKLKGIELLSEAAQFEIDTQKAMKASKRTSKFQHQSGGSSEGDGLRPKVPDEPSDKSAYSDEGAGTSPEVLDESKDKSEARDNHEDWGSTDDETFLFNEKDEKIKDILWKSTNDESEDDDEEDESDDDDDKSIDIEKTNDERIDTDVEDQDNEELKADEEQKGDDQAGDEQLVVPVQQHKKDAQSASIHLQSFLEINSLLDIQIQQDVPNIQQEPFHAVKVSAIPETTQIPPTTPLAPPLPSIKIPSTQKVLWSHTEELKKELSEKKDYKDVIEESVQANVINEVKNFLPKFLLQAVNEALQKTPPSLELYDALMWSMLLDGATTKEGDKPDTILKKRDHGDDQDKDPLAGSNQGKKTKKRRANESKSSKKTSTIKESYKGKSLARTSKSGKSVTTKESVEEPVFEIALNDVEQTIDDKVGDAGQPPHTDADETQADGAPRIPKKDWFKEAPRPETLDPDWNTVKTVDDTLKQLWFNEMVQAEKPPLMFNELMSTPINFSAFAINRLKLNKITRADLVGPVFNLLKDQLDCTNPEGHKSPVNMSKPLPLQEKEGRLTIPIEFFFNNDLEYLKAGVKERMYSSSITKTPAARSRYGYLKEIVIRRADQKLYKFKEGNFLNLHLNDIEDMLLLISHNKFFNLDGDVIMDFVTALKMFTRGIIVKNRHISVKEPYTPNYDPPKIIYEDKSKKKRLMRVDVIHKFSDGTLQYVCKILRNRLLNFKFGYNKDTPLREWTTKDKKCTGIMLNKIDDMLFKRRVLRSLEVLVGGRKIETDKRLL
ncbi:hypothetical protein Tco_0161632 [Tanacetum coccineum]